jgi:hypothetical protein
MIGQAVAQNPSQTVRYVTADGAAIPFANGFFDLITAVNVFIFWEETTRVLAPGGALAIEYSLAESTPIYLPGDVVERHLSRAGTYRFEHGRAGRGTWILARKLSA